MLSQTSQRESSSRTLRIVALAPNAWEGPWMNRQQLLSRLGHHHAVLYSTGPRRRFQGTSEPVIRPRIIARDNVITQILNGRIINMLIDDEPEKRAMEGLLGLQIHQGPPMQVEFKNIYLKNLP